MATGRRIAGIGPVPEGLEENLTDFLIQLRRVALEVQSGRVSFAVDGVGAGSGGGSPVPGPAGPPGPPGTPGEGADPDLTPPPTPTGLTVTAGFANILVEWDAATYTQGHGHLQTNIYGAKWPSGTPPTFSDAVVIGEAASPLTIYAHPTELGTRWCIWLKFLSRDDVESVSPAGGTNGVQATTGVIGNSDLGPLIIEAGNLANGAVTAAAFAAGIQPVAIVSTLPSPSGYTGPRAVFLTTDGKLYRYVGGAWVTTVPAADITGQITGTQITNGAISTPQLAANAVTAANIAPDTITAAQIAANAITANELAANSVIAGKIAAAAVSATEIAALAIQAQHLAANSIAVGTAAIQNGAIVNAMIANATIDNAKIVNLSVNKLLAGSIGVGEYIQSPNYVAGLSGWRINGSGVAEFGFASIRGTLLASQVAAGFVNAAMVGANQIITSTANIGDATITNAKLTGNIQSDNFAAGSTGWQVRKSDGGAEFSNVRVRGDVQATSLNAATGTFSGTLTALAVNAVDTINLADQALLVPVSVVGTSGTHASGSGEVTLASAAVTLSSVGVGGGVAVVASVMASVTSTPPPISGSTTTTITVRLRRDGVLIATSQPFSAVAGAGTSANITTPASVIFNRFDSVAAGTYTYSITLQTTGSGGGSGSAQWGPPGVLLLGAKK